MVLEFLRSESGKPKKMSMVTTSIGLLIAAIIWLYSAEDSAAKLIFSGLFLSLWFLFFDVILGLCTKEDESARKKPVLNEITACTRCGSRDVSPFKHTKYWLKKDGPVMGICTCQKCGYDGIPIVFDSITEYEKFLKSK
ncbi:MAG: hypothetical protein PHG85_03860 [Candidatus Altiarchaeota archaeon]|nr:hypothetical protein [Candidatus Altiarchaeota archaeon]